MQRALTELYGLPSRPIVGGDLDAGGVGVCRVTLVLAGEDVEEWSAIGRRRRVREAPHTFANRFAAAVGSVVMCEVRQSADVRRHPTPPCVDEDVVRRVLSVVVRAFEETLWPLAPEAAYHCPRLGQHEAVHRGRETLEHGRRRGAQHRSLVCG